MGNSKKVSASSAAAQQLSVLAERWSRRPVIDHVQPTVDQGRFPIKRTPGEAVQVSAHIMVDGHDQLSALVKARRQGETAWQEIPMINTNSGLNLWSASFTVEQLGMYEYTLEAWIDAFATWQVEFRKKVDAGSAGESELLEGAAWVSDAATRATAVDRDWLNGQAAILKTGKLTVTSIQAGTSDELTQIMRRYPDRARAVEYDRVFTVRVDDVRARFGAWYEFFPRSASLKPGTHGTLNDAAARLPRIAEMGFDTVYLPPVHPIGTSFRKGPNNALNAGPGDPGSPWAIGSPAGGHKAIHPDLGTLADFDRFVKEAGRLGMEVALDIAFQCSPDHPYVKEHPEWFKHRPDGSIKYAENPPKKYQDIYPLDFECAAWESLWMELKSVFLFWLGHGVRVFRVDNPHTKPFRFWEWVIGEVQELHPEAVFLAEAFTKPPVMQYLAKVGFSQSYTYFTWRNAKWELMDYLTELTSEPLREVMRPNLFANTPDIFHEYLQHGGKAGYMIRLVLAATLGASYGIYGPPFEWCESRALPNSEDYLDSEKYQIRHWPWTEESPMQEWITRINAIRRENTALHDTDRLRFYPIDNDQMLFYGKTSEDGANTILVVVNLDPHNAQSGWVQVPMDDLGLGPEPYQVHDLLSDARYVWSGPSNFIRLVPSECPAHIFRVRRRLKSEKDFDYFI